MLWVSNADGSSARSIATVAANTSRPFATRWTGDAQAVAYATDDSITVINLDGTHIDIRGLGQMRAAGFRLIDQRWSPSGKRVAATLQRSTDGKTDLWIGSLDRRELVAAGVFGNAFFGDWLSDDEVLVESDTGVLGALQQPGQPIRKLVDTAAASPFFDGRRVFFLAGSVGPTITASGIFVTNPSVMSVRADGQDLRSEGRLEVLGSLRLDGIWPDTRYLMHPRASCGAPWSARIGASRSVSADRASSGSISRAATAPPRAPSSYCSMACSARMPGSAGALPPRQQSRRY